MPNLPINRAVALLTPVFTVTAAIVSGFVARHVGVSLSPDELVAIEAAGATAAFGAAFKWLHGHQKYERIVSDTEAQVRAIVLHAHEIGVKVPSGAEVAAEVEKKAAQLAQELAQAEARLAQVHAAVAPKQEIVDPPSVASTGLPHPQAD